MALALCYPNRFDGGTLSGQGWTSSLPLSNLSTRQISQVARAHQPIARFYLNKTGLAAHLACLVGHNMGTAGQMRIRAWASDPRTPLDASSKAAVLDLPFSDWTALPSAFTFTSAAGYYWGSDGLLKTASANQPRFTHDRSTGAPLGLLLEGQMENRALWCRDGSNAAWTKNANMGTPALSATGIDGVANSATRLTANGTNARISQTATGSGTLRAGFWLRRVSGSSTISITGNNFGGLTTVALTSAWQWFSESFTSGSQFGIQIAGAGDVIEMDFAYVGNFASTGPGPTPIYTSASVQARTGDTLTYSLPAAMQASTLNGGLVWRGIVITPANVNGSNDTTLLQANGATSLTVRLAQSSSNVAQMSAFGTNIWRSGSAPTYGTRFGLAFGWAATNTHVFRMDGSTGLADASPNTVSGAFTSIALTPTNYASVIHDRLCLFSTALDGTDCATLSNQTATEPTPAYDSGWLNAWPASWVSGTTAEQQSGVRGFGLCDFSALQTYAWWRFDLSDPTNSASYVQLGRVFMGEKWTPQYGATSGATLGYRDRATSIEAADGARYFVDQNNPKTARFNLDGQTREAVMRYVLDLQRRQGSTREVLFMLDDADQTYLLETAFLGTLKQLTPPTAISANFWSASVEMEELL